MKYTMKVLSILFPMLSILLQSVFSVSTVQPIWRTSNLIRAGNRDVISTRTSSSSTPTYTFIFTSSLSATPYLGYGVKSYQGNDYLAQQFFQVNRTNLNPSSFSVAVQILRSTYVMRLSVSYIAIDPTFPHHINSFDNVPVNYSAGPIINISTSSSTSMSYTNVINYTQQATLLSYKSFEYPLNRSKVLLFLTSLFISGSLQGTSTILRPINLTVNSEIVSTSQYKLTVTITNDWITKLHFSMIIFDQLDVTSSGIYMLVNERVTFAYTGGFIPVPVEFIDNFIMGLLCFQTNKTQNIIVFQWNFRAISGVHGVSMPLSVGQTYQPYGAQTLNQVTFTLFYMKTWYCPNQTFFDPLHNLCTSCPISNCLACLNLTSCSLCDEINNFFLNLTTKDCYYQFVDNNSTINNTSIENLCQDGTTLSKVISNTKYNDNECRFYSQGKKAVLPIQVICWILFFVSLFSGRITGLEMFGVLQLAYISLAEHDSINIYLSYVVEFRIFNGINIPLFFEQSSLPPNLKLLGIAQIFINNCNIMLIVLYSAIVISLVLRLAAKFCNHPKILSRSTIIIKEGLMILIMFNCFNVAFSAGIHWKYNNNSTDFASGPVYVFSICVMYVTLVVIMTAVGSFMLLQETYYGQFKNKFKNDYVCRCYIAISILYRMAIGFYIALQHDYPDSALLILVVPLIFMMYNLTNLPFVSAMQNYRCNIIHITQLIILYCANYYRSMKLNVPVEIKSHLHTMAIIQLVMIVVCIILSAFVMIYELVRKIKNLRDMNRQVNQQLSFEYQNRNSTLETLAIQNNG